MPDLKFSQLSQIAFSDLVSNDLIPVVQVAAGTAGSKVILAGGIIAALAGKQASSNELTGLSSLSGTGFVRRTGASTYSASSLSPSDIPSDAIADVNVTATAAIAWSKISKSGAVPADVGAIGYSALSASSPLSYNSGTGVFTIQQANGSQAGFLSSTDWNTFNGKQSALGYTPLAPANNLSDLSSVSTARTNLGLVPGTDVQAYSARLQEITSAFASATDGYFIRKKADGSGLEYAAASNGAVWGAITGTLSDQTDLNTALSGKQDSSVELSGVAALSTTGIVKRTGSGTYTAGVLIASDIPNSSITDAKVAAGAAIAWSKIDKTGAVASDVGAIGLSGLSASAPLSYDSGTGAFSIQQANGSQSGFLTSSDWATFNGKQAALGYVPLNPANNLSDLITPSTARSNLGLVIGTDVQAYSARLADIVSNFGAASNLQVLRKNVGGTALEYATISATYSPIVYRVNNADYSIPGDADIVISYAQTATRTFTLPTGVSSGKRIVVRDGIGASWYGMPIVIQRGGSDTINGFNQVYLETPYQELILTYDTTGSWSCIEPVTPKPDSWYVTDTWAYSGSGSSPFPAHTGSGLTVTNLAATDGIGLCTNGSLATGSTSRGGHALFGGNSSLQFGGGTWYVEILFNITSSLMNGTDGFFLLGFHNGYNSAVNTKPTNGIYLMHNQATSSNWIYGSVASSSRNETTSSTAVSNSSYIRAAFKFTPSLAEYSINRSLLGSLSATLPSGSSQRTSLAFYCTRNNSNTGSGAFVYNLFQYRLLFYPTTLR